MASLAPTPQPRAAIYCRVSTPGQKEEGYSLEGQVTECQNVAERMGAVVAPHLIFREVGSGADWDLPKLLELLDRAQRREFDVLICLATSRLARDVGKLAVLQRTLKRAGVTVHYVHHQFDDTPTGQLTETMLAAIDVYERQNSALRFALGKRAKVARNLVMGTGPTPYGYRTVRNEKGRTIGLEVDPDTAPIVRRIFREATHRALVEICAGLDAEGVRPPGRAARWSEGTVGAMLRNPVYIGRSAFGRRRWLQVVAPDGRRHEVRLPRDESEVQYADCPALVTPSEQQAAIAALADRKHRHAGGRVPDADHPYALRGMLTCGLCGGPLAVERNNGLRYYLCLRYQPGRARKQGRERCALPSVRADALEAEAWRLVCSVLLDREHLSAGLEEARRVNRAADRKRERLEHLRAEIGRIEKALDKQAVELLKAEDGSATEAALRRAGRELEDRSKSLRASVAELDAQPVEGLGDDDVEAVEQFAAEVRAGIGAAGPADQHRIYKLLRLQGTIREDPENGVPLKRRRFSIDWQAILELRHETTRLSILPGT